VYACHTLAAILVCMPDTRRYRMALVPVAFAFAYRTVTVYDVTGGGIRPPGLHLMFGVSSMTP
jgi:hypothetical protein